MPAAGAMGGVMMADTGLFKAIEALLCEGVPFCVATLVDGRGSIPQVVGARAIFTRTGLAHGTVGGGRLEMRCRATAAEMLDAPHGVRHRFERLNLNRDVGMTCAGEVSVYFEVHRPDQEWHVVIFGAGHVAQSLCRFLIELDCRITCIDTRAEWLERLPRTPTLEPVRVENFAEGVERIGTSSMVLVMTMGHSSDKPILHAIAAREFRPPLLGVLGSDSKARILRRELRHEGMADEDVDRIVCPLGDKIGNNTPGEIAVGIVSQLLRLRRATCNAPA